MSGSLTWRRLAGATVALFAVILAFLAGRVHAGADPALRARAAHSQPSATPTPAPDEQYGLPDGGLAPGTGSPGDGVVPDTDPPTTHAS
jgi:hypothetical protein